MANLFPPASMEKSLRFPCAPTPPRCLVGGSAVSQGSATVVTGKPLCARFQRAVEMVLMVSLLISGKLRTSPPDTPGTLPVA